jgi:hypothetical protein
MATDLLNSLHIQDNASPNSTLHAIHVVVTEQNRYTEVTHARQLSTKLSFRIFWYKP